MSDEDRRCGTCRWWKRGFVGVHELPIGKCLWVPSKRRLPFWFTDSNVVETHEDDGTNCPCWAKESDDGE